MFMIKVKTLQKCILLFPVNMTFLKHNYYNRDKYFGVFKAVLKTAAMDT